MPYCRKFKYQYVGLPKKLQFFKKYKKIINRHQINNLMYKMRINREFITNKNDIVSSANLIKKYTHYGKCFSNIDLISSINEIIIIFQHNNQHLILKNSKTNILCFDSTHCLTM